MHYINANSNDYFIYVNFNAYFVCENLCIENETVIHMKRIHELN